MAQFAVHPKGMVDFSKGGIVFDPQPNPFLRRANRRTILRGSLGASAIALGGLSRWDAARAQAGTPTADDPLPSWNEGEIKRNLIDFTQRSIERNTEDYLPVGRRIATFDVDGTLFTEFPGPAVWAFVLHATKTRAEIDPAYAAMPVVQAALGGAFDDPAEIDFAEFYHLVDMTGAGMPVERVTESARSFLETAVHPVTGNRWVDQTYQPMKELISLLAQSGYTIFCVSGSGVEFLRAFVPATLGIPIWQIVGTTTHYAYAGFAGKGEVVETDVSLTVNTGDNKAITITRHVGERPVIAMGNSDGDIEMIDYARGGGAPDLYYLIHHTDAAREFEYDRDYLWSPLRRGLEPNKQIPLINMKTDWATVWSMDAPATLDINI